jgi:hypothetical protein
MAISSTSSVIAMANTPSLNASMRVVRNAGTLAGFCCSSVILQILKVHELPAEGPTLRHLRRPIADCWSRSARPP